VPTLYVRNLNDKIKAEGNNAVADYLCIELKIALYHLFSAAGEVIEINCRQQNNS